MLIIGKYLIAMLFIVYLPDGTGNTSKRFMLSSSFLACGMLPAWSCFCLYVLIRGVTGTQK